VGLTYIAFACLLVALLTAGMIAWQVIQQYKEAKLPQAPGVMVSCETILSQTDGVPTSANTARAAPMWTIRSRYTYTVDGKEYNGHVFSQRKVGKIQNRVTVDSTAPESIAKFCRQYAPGSAVQVYYYADDPQTSFIYFNPPYTDWQWILIPLVAALFSAFFFVVANFARKTGR
jgi:hypothetical protein